MYCVAWDPSASLFLAERDDDSLPVRESVAGNSASAYPDVMSSIILPAAATLAAFAGLGLLWFGASS